MPDSLGSRLKHAWNAFRGQDSAQLYPYNLGPSYGSRPDRIKLNIGTERTILSSIFTRIAIDIASINIRHVRLDENERFLEVINSGLNNCLSLEANIDQSGRDFIEDITLSLFEEGAIAIVPVDTTINPAVSGSYDITSMRTAKILEWYPRNVRLELYNDQSGRKEQIILPKSTVAIIENPLYLVMNEPNSTLRRLIQKLYLLDAIDQQSGSGKLDLLIQLPYIIRTPARKEQAEIRRKDIEEQLAGSKYGIAYTDGTEKVTQLNRPAENNLMAQIEFLTSMLYSQLGVTTSVIDGTADEKTMLNYYNRTVEPILASIVDAMRRSFLTKTARTQGQSIKYFRDPFKLVPTADLATIGDTFTRSEILSSNDIRALIGYRPSKEPGADDLRNKNLNPVTPETKQTSTNEVPDDKEASDIKMKGSDKE